jgi:hypothetical protein
MERNEYFTKATSMCTYIASGSLVIGDFLNRLDHHAAAFGVLIGFISCISNIFFKWRLLRAKKNNAP